MATDSITKELDDLHKQARSARRQLEPDWFMSLAYYQNKQWLKWAGGQLHNPDLNNDRIVLTENRVTGVVRTELAKMTKNRPVFTVTPRTGDEEDANASHLAEQLMRYLWKHLNMPELSFKALEWSRICGAGFLKCYWDPTVGEGVEVLIKQDGNLLTSGQGGPVRHGSPEAALAMQMANPGTLQVKRIAQGDIKVEVRSPFQMFVDPLADSFVEAEWCIEESIKSVQYMRQRFGDKAQGLKADAAANPGLVEARLMGGSQLTGQSYKGVKVREYWCKPGIEHPNGCRIVWAQGKVLVQDEKPFDPMPYVMLSSIPVPGRLWAMSIVDLLRGPQTELNKVRSQMAENRNRVGNPTVLVSKQAVQNIEQFAESMTRPGGIFPFDETGSANAIPSYLQAPPLPEYVTEEPTIIRQAIEDISGQHEVTNAQVPPGVTAASAITLLQEADDTRLGPGITDYEQNLGRFGQKVLKLGAAYYTDARTVKIAGDDGTWQIFDFRGSMLRDNTHVEVQAGSAFPQSKAAKQAMIQDWMTFFVQSGNPPHGKQLVQFMKDSEVGGLERLISEYANSEGQIARENTLLAQGMQLPLNPYDDNQAHLDGHEEFERSARFTQLAPQGQQAHLAHTAEHRQAVAAEQQQAMALQMQAQGQPPPDQAAQMQQMQAQGQAQQQQGQSDQQAQQLQAAGQQQGFQAASQEQSQRQAEEKHNQSQLSLAQQQRLELEKHHQALQHAEEIHKAKLEQIRRQGAQRGNQKAAQ